MSSKTTKTETKKPVDETRAIMKKAIAEKQKTVRDTEMYKRMKNAIVDAINKAASEGQDDILIPTVVLPGELGMPEQSLGNVIARCNDPVTIVDSLVDEFDKMGYTIFTFGGVPISISWAEIKDQK